MADLDCYFGGPFVIGDDNAETIRLQSDCLIGTFRTGYLEEKKSWKRLELADNQVRKCKCDMLLVFPSRTVVFSLD